MKRFTTWFLFVAALALFAAPLFAAGNQEAGSTSGEKMTINWMCQFKDPWVFQYLADKFNVNIVSNGIYVNDTERVNVMLAAGEFPDCGPLFQSSVDMYTQGVSRAIPKDAIKQYAPDIAKIYDTYPEAWFANENPDNPNELLDINGISATTDYNIFLPMLRVDWLKNIGVTLPNYEQKKIPLDSVGRVFFLDQDVTLKQYEQWLYAFRDGDADGNGKKDTIPYGANNNLWRSFAQLAGAFGISYNNNQIYNGQLYDYRIHPRMKDLLIMLNKWYADGLIDSEFASQDLNKGWAKITAGLVASTAEVVTYAGTVGMENRPPNSFVPDSDLGKPDAQVVVLPSLIGPYGDQGASAYRLLPGDGGYRWFIGQKVSDAKMDKILQIINYARGTEEGFIYFQYGKPGVHFDWEGDPWNSKPISRKPEDIPAGENKQGFASPYPPFYTADRVKFVYSAALAHFADVYLNAPRGQAQSYRSARFDIKNETKLADINAKYGATLNTLYNEFFFKAVTGEIDPATEWDNYVKQFRQNGGDEMLAELAKAPLTEALRQGKLQY